MKVRVLGCSGAIAKDCRTTSFLVDNDVLIDAGTGVGDLTLAEMARIEHVFLTHSHLDHVAALPLMVDAVASRRLQPLMIHALAGTIQALRTHIFNDVIWPDFSRIPTPEAPFITFHEIHTGQTLEVNRKLLEVLPAVHTVPAVVVESGLAESGWIPVDRRTLATRVPNVYAVGDVTDRIQLTPVALAEAMVVVDQLFGPPAGKPARSMDYAFIPTAVFTHPNIGTVGFSEQDAPQHCGKITVYRSDFKALKHTLSGSSERTLMKLVVQDETDKVIGLHMVGPDAGEIVQGFAVALKAGATKAVFDNTIGIHPTAAEEFVTMREPVRQAAPA